MPHEPTVTRRTLMQTAAAGGAAALAANGLPAWARPIVRATHLRHPGSRPFPHLPAGTASMPEIKHIVVLIMENHSFDNLLGMVPYQVPGRAGVDGLTRHRGAFKNFNRATNGTKVFAQHASTPCQLHAVPSQAWNASHQAYDNGRNDGFVRASGPIAMRFWDQADLPFTYSLVKHFPIGQRFFCSTLCQTYPNRRFFFAGTASGAIDDKAYALITPAANGTILDRLDAHHIRWRVYADPLASDLILPNVRNNKPQASNVGTIDQFIADSAAGHLRQFTFIDPNYDTTSEENPQDIQVGEQFVAKIVHALMHAPTWKNTALFITYDEHGGYYDHVPPRARSSRTRSRPRPSPATCPAPTTATAFACRWSSYHPGPSPTTSRAASRTCTSITAFIERKWNLPAMTYRDANADPMTDYFNLHHASFAKPPRLAAALPLGPGLAKCKAAGLTPPLPPGVSEQSASPAPVHRAARRWPDLQGARGARATSADAAAIPPFRRRVRAAAAGAGPLGGPSARPARAGAGPRAEAAPRRRIPAPRSGRRAAPRTARARSSRA